jgi:hypothetical protein
MEAMFDFGLIFAGPGAHQDGEDFSLEKNDGRQLSRVRFQNRR